MPWIRKFKVSIINEDFDVSVQLLKESPVLEKEQALEVQALIRSALVSVQERKDTLSKDMMKLKEVQKYIS